VSKALPYTSKADVEAFFTSPEHRPLWINGGGKSKCERIEMTPKILNEWITKCESLEGCIIPTEADNDVYVVQTSGMKIPGLTVEVLVTVGMKLVTDPSSGGSTYQVTMIEDKRQATGLGFLIYLYNKMTGSGKKSGSSNIDDDDGSGSGSSGGSGGDHGSSNTTALTTIRYKFNDDTTVTFEMETKFHLKVHFPKFLLRIMPTNQEKAEGQGSRAITNAIQKDTIQCLKAMEEVYEKTFPTNTTSSS